MYQGLMPDYYHGCLSRPEAERRLEKFEDGDFLVRTSDNRPGCYILNVKWTPRLLNIIIPENPIGEGFMFFGEVVPTIKQWIQRHLDSNAPVNPPIEARLRRPVPLPRANEMDIERIPESRLYMQLDPAKKNSLRRKNSLRIEVISGSICEQEVDAIVSSVGEHLNLNRGVLSKAVLTAAGDGIQRELSQKGPGKPGDVLVTFGYRLPCQHVLHAVFPSSDQLAAAVGDAMNFRVLIQSILVVASELNVQSLAIPPIGTERLGYSPDVAAQIMGEVLQTLKASDGGALKEIRFVVVESQTATFKAFREVLQSNDRVDPSVDTGGRRSAYMYVGLQKESDHMRSDASQHPKGYAGAEDSFVYAVKPVQPFRDPHMVIQQHFAGNRFDNLMIDAHLCIQFPPTWTSTKSEKSYEKFEVQRYSAEFQTVTKAMTPDERQKYFPYIYKIERIQNPEVYEMYAKQKEIMRNSKEPYVKLERTLWHGTSVDKLENICEQGFSRSICERATIYGKGVCSTKEFSYSARDEFSRRDKHGNKYVIQCSVLTGDFVVGNSNWVAPPELPTGVLCDSTVDDVVDPSVFIVFNDFQMYPLYVVTLLSPP